MDFSRQYNTKSAGVKRLMKEALELREPTELYAAQPLEDNLFEWHFTVRGPADSPFEGGIYHGRIMFPPEYPMKPPNLVILTPNGRFELYKKICLSISGYHPETWLPSWSIRTALLALIGFMPSESAGAIGSLDYPEKERKRLAKVSHDWKCKDCGAHMKEALKPLTGNETDIEREARELAAKVLFKDESEVKAAVSASTSQNETPSETELPDVSNGEGDRGTIPQDTNNTQSEVEEEPSDPTPPRPTPSTVPSAGSATPVTTVPATPIRRPQTNDYSLFVIIPATFLCLSIFILLLARRMVM